MPSDNEFQNDVLSSSSTYSKALYESPKILYHHHHHHHHHLFIVSVHKEPLKHKKEKRKKHGVERCNFFACGR